MKKSSSAPKKEKAAEAPPAPPGVPGKRPPRGHRQKGAGTVQTGKVSRGVVIW
jgi:hypothetical protein